ncbi:MAG: hypothetical protein WCF40_01640 [Desulfobacterales bacterium]|jgi:hypothetical protein
MIANKKTFNIGLIMMVAFIVVLVIFFMPVFNGHNGLNYLDSLFNSISKGSAHFVPRLKEEVRSFDQKAIDVNLALKSAEQARQTALMFQKAGAAAEAGEEKLKVSGNMGQIFAAILEDSDAMFFNDSQKVADRYGFEARQALFNWWTALNAMEKALTNQKKFSDAAMVATVRNRAVEVAFNFYQIEPQSISDKYGIVIFSLLFYVIYTLWYGFAIMFMFEGWGMKMEH